jgi:hypothetical protein
MSRLFDCLLIFGVVVPGCILMWSLAILTVRATLALLGY